MPEPINYTITEFPVDDLIPFNTWAQSDIFPENIGWDSDGIADNMGPDLLPFNIQSAGGNSVQFDIIPTDSSTHYTTVEMFNIAGQTPTSEAEWGTDPGPGFTQGMPLKSRVWVSGSTVYNTANNQVSYVLHPWISEVHMFDMLPVETVNQNSLTSQNAYPHRWIRVVAVIANQNTMIPPFDYSIVLDLDGDAQVHPPPFVGSQFSIYCEIAGGTNQYDAQTCSKVYPMVPPCYNTLNDSGWSFYPELIDDFNARIVCTYIGNNPNQPLDLTCDNQNPYALGVMDQMFNMQPWFHISPNSGYILSRWNCQLPNAFASETASSSVFGGVDTQNLDANGNPVYGTIFLQGVEMISGGFLPFGYYGTTTVDGYNLEVTSFDDFNIASTSLVEYTPANFPGLYPYPTSSQGWSVTEIALIDTVQPQIDSDAIYDILASINSGNTQTDLYGNNVIVMFRGLSGYIPGPNPPDLKIKVLVNNCAMLGVGSYEEEWIYFEDISIYEIDDIFGQIDITTINGTDFGEEWGEDE